MPRLIDRDWEGEMGGYFVGPAIFIFCAIIVFGSILLIFGFQFLRRVSWVIYLIFGRLKVTYEAWDHVFCRSLWTLPWAFGTGAVVYILYFALECGGSPDDVIVGFIGNILGALCYVTIFYNWYRLIQDTTTAKSSENPPSITHD